MIEKQQKRIRRHRRVRSKVYGTGNVPRLCVFRSNKHITTQIIDDDKGRTILNASDIELKKFKGNKTELAKKVGELIAKKAKEKTISKIIFDRGGYKYHGRVKALAEGAREGGLKF